MKEKPIQFVGTGETNNRITAADPENQNQPIQGKLTSRIETRQDKIASQTYYYGFFKIEGYEQEIPVIFKNPADEYYKPNLKKGTQVELTGTWSSGEERPSFTCFSFKLINPVEPTKEKSNIYQKLHLVQSQTGKIAKSELNKYQNYKYFTEQQALNILKPLLNEYKLTLTFSDVCEPTKDYHNRGELEKQKTEKEWVISYLKQAILTNSEVPQEQLTFHFWAIGSNTDPAKAKGCAETYATRYCKHAYY